MISPISLGCQVEAAWTATIPKDLFMLERGNGRNPSQAYPDYLGLIPRCRWRSRPGTANWIPLYSLPVWLP
jgi:hypothetical protein